MKSLVFASIVVTLGALLSGCGASAGVAVAPDGTVYVIRDRALYRCQEQGASCSRASTLE